MHGNSKNILDTFLLSLENPSEYKQSRYNVYTRSQSGIFLIMNTYSGEFCKVYNDSGDENQFRNIGDYEKEKLLKLFLAKGYLLRSDISEENRMSVARLRSINNHNGLTLTLIPTYDCNFHCRYCFENKTSHVMEQEIQDAVILYIEKNIARFEFLNIEWFGGEPLLQMDMIENMSKKIKKISRENAVPYIAAVTTNGYNLTVENFIRLLKNRVIDFRVTLDGNQEDHNAMRCLEDGTGTFDKILNNLIDIRDKVESNIFTVTIYTTLTNANLKGMPDFTKLLVRAFGQDSRFKFYWKPVQNNGGSRIASVEHLLCSYEEIIPYLREAAEDGLQFGYTARMRAGGRVCNAAKNNNFIIDTDGSIYKCSVWKDDERNTVGKLTSKGNMLIDEDKMAIWTGTYDRLKKECSSCSYWPCCQGLNCPIEKYTKNECTCPFEKRNIKKLMDIVSSNDLYCEAIDLAAAIKNSNF